MEGYYFRVLFVEEKRERANEGVTGRQTFYIV